MTSVYSGALASIHHQYVTVHIGGCVRSQKDSGPFQIMVRSKAARWNMAEQIVSFMLNDFVRHVRGKPAGGNCVDLDVMSRPFHGKIARK